MERPSGIGMSVEFFLSVLGVCGRIEDVICEAVRNEIIFPEAVRNEIIIPEAVRNMIIIPEVWRDESIWRPVRNQFGKISEVLGSPNFWGVSCGKV